MDLEFDIGNEIWAITDCAVRNTRECPTCGQSVVNDISFKQVSQGIIIGVDIKLRKDQTAVICYSCDFDGVIAESITKLWKTRKEAEDALDVIADAIETN